MTDWLVRTEFEPHLRVFRTAALRKDWLNKSKPNEVCNERAQRLPKNIQVQLLFDVAAKLNYLEENSAAKLVAF